MVGAWALMLGMMIDMNVMDVKRGIFSVPVMCDQDLNVLFQKDGGKSWFVPRGT